MPTYQDHVARPMPILLVQETVKKSCVIAYFEGTEQELIVIPQKEGDLTDVGVVEEQSRRKKKHA
jgi:hypothetical protein